MGDKSIGWIMKTQYLNNHPKLSFYVTRNKQSQQRKHQNNALNMFEVNKMTSFWCLYSKLWTDLTHCSAASVIDFEQTNASCFSRKGKAVVQEYIFIKMVKNTNYLIHCYIFTKSVTSADLENTLLDKPVTRSMLIVYFLGRN